MNAPVQDTAPETIAGELLEFLRGEFGDCSYAEPLTALAPGNETLICAFRLKGLAPPLDAPLILRLFAPGMDPEHARAEAAIQNAVAEQGFPAARAFATCSDDRVLGSPFFIMQRLPGRPFLGDALELDADGVPQMRPWHVLRKAVQMLRDMPRKLAEIDARMHGLDAARVIADLEVAGVAWQTRSVEGQLHKIATSVDKGSADGLRDGVDWLYSHLPSSKDPVVVCHGDMQPLNLMVAEREVSGVVDWSNTLFAPAECEIGWTRSTFLTLPLPIPAALLPAERMIAATIANGYTRAYQRARSCALDEDAIRYHEAFHDLRILADMVARDPEAALKRDAWNTQRAIEKLTGHFFEISGKRLVVPDLFGGRS